MNERHILPINDHWPTLAQLPVPARVLASALLLMMTLGLVGALGQIIVHDIIPTFFSPEAKMEMGAQMPALSGEADRGDLFDDLAQTPAPPEAVPKVDHEQFVWLLKWTHIHLFGMNLVFILLGGVTIFLKVSQRRRTWLVLLPFTGVLVDILAMWLKAYVSPIFFWLHLPGGGLFAVVFVYVFCRAMWEMWWSSYA